MKTTMTFKAALLTLIALTTVNVYAEKLSGFRDTIPQFAFQLMTQAGSNSASYTDGVGVYDNDTNDVFRLFCTDLYTSTSTAFGGEGQLYHTATLTESPFHTETQKVQLQSLFDHVYTKAFNADYSAKDSLYSTIFQLAVWEIANDTSDRLSLRDGDIYITNALVIKKGPEGQNQNYWDRTVLQSALDTLDTWFSAIINNNWEAIGYSEDKVDLTIYLAEGGTDKSQTFIGVKPGVGTPEPATMLIIGLGFAGLSLVRRRK
jgi:hypothetical protein